MDDSRDLVRDASRGDRAAVDALLERFLPELRGYVEHRAGRELLARESGADLVQSVCRELFEGLAARRFEYRGEREFRQWLYGAALLKLEGRHRYWHTQKREAAREVAPPCGSASSHGEPGPADSATPSADAMRHEEVEHLRGAIALLPENYRRVLELAHFDGLSHQEIAARLGIAETHSRVLLTRALARLATLAARRRQ